MGEELGGALEAELQVRPACPAQPSPAQPPFLEQNNRLSWRLVHICGQTGHKTAPACSRQLTM